MYLIGADLTGNTGFASMVLVQRIRKNLEKYYHVQDIQRSHYSSDTDSFTNAIAGIYNNANYTIRKPRFSQIGRPKKMVNEKPLIFVAYGDAISDWINNLKDCKIPANCVFVTNEDDWYLHVPGRCLKSDFYIPKKQLIKIVLNVFEDERLIMNTEDITTPILRIYKAYKGLRDENLSVHQTHPLDDLMLALAMPVWYYENLLAIRPRTP